MLEISEVLDKYPLLVVMRDNAGKGNFERAVAVVKQGFALNLNTSL
jgi:hypothetical protein